MNHRPFEDWILDGPSLKSEQKRELQVHLQECPRCTALAEVNLELRSAKMASPAAGFTARFQTRLVRQRLLERRNRLIGVLFLVLGGIGLIAWFTVPVAVQFLSSPVGWIAAILNFLLVLLDMLRAIGDIGSILLRVLPGFIPPLGWMILLSAISGFILLWMVSIWRLTRFTKGV